MGGHRAEFTREHTRAAALQKGNPHLVIWFGEATGSYWVASRRGLIEARTADELLLLLETVPAPA